MNSRLWTQSETTFKSTSMGLFSHDAVSLTYSLQGSGNGNVQKSTMHSDIYELDFFFIGCVKLELIRAIVICADLQNKNCKPKASQ
jgi:hypothetical protein